MKALELHQHLESVGNWVDWQTTCDRFITGDPKTIVQGIAVTWQASFNAIKTAFSSGCNMLVTHEPLFYSHRDDDVISKSHPAVKEKSSFVEDNGVVVYRCHDLWDRMPRVGIVDSWASQLDLGEKKAYDEYHAMYDAPVGTLGALADYVLDHTVELGQKSVQIIGDAGMGLSKVAIGCGAITDVKRMIALGADAIIASDDGIDYWKDGSWLMDIGIPTVVVNHAVSEEPGIHNLWRYIRANFSKVHSIHIPHGCVYQSVCYGR